MALTAAELQAKKGILLMDVNEFLAYNRKRFDNIGPGEHIRAIQVVKNELGLSGKYDYTPVILMLTQPRKNMEGHNKDSRYWGKRTTELLNKRLKEHGLKLGQFSDKKSAAILTPDAEQEFRTDVIDRPGIKHAKYIAALNKYIAHLKSLETAQTTTIAKGVTMQTSAHELAIKFGNKATPADIEATKKEITTLLAQRFGPSDDTEAAHAPPPP